VDIEEWPEIQQRMRQLSQDDAAMPVEDVRDMSS
jgi:hypothetical protein